MGRAGLRFLKPLALIVAVRGHSEAKAYDQRQECQRSHKNDAQIFFMICRDSWVSPVQGGTGHRGDRQENESKHEHKKRIMRQAFHWCPQLRANWPFAIGEHDQKFTLPECETTRQVTPPPTTRQSTGGQSA